MTVTALDRNSWLNLDWSGLGEWSEFYRGINQTEFTLPASSRLVARVWEHVLATPTAVAVLDDAGALSYEAMWSDALAVHDDLLQAGVCPGDFVGVCCQRDRRLPGTLIGVWLAGAAYVPLDLEYPRERLQHVIEDTKLAVIVTDDRTAVAGLGGDCVLVERSRSLPSKGDGERSKKIIASCTESAAAYVIHTSGSTGRPKGVVVGQRSAFNLLNSLARCPGFGPADRMLASTTLAFDISFVELFLPLFCGGSVVVVSRAVARDPIQLIDTIKEQSLSTVFATPAHWRMMCESGFSGDPRLKLWTGGEALTRSLADALLGRGAELWNLYGPTETTVCSTLTRVWSSQETITIGGPIDNTLALVVNEQGQLCGPDECGELYLGGEGMAYGYWQRPELTNERFVNYRGVTMYRTGDWVRPTAEGHFEHLGRIDSQVKIRGHRIELGEIEAALNACPGVLEGVVQRFQPDGGEAYLVGYVRCQAPEFETLKNIREQLTRELPEYMLPGRWQVLEQFPLTPNGKLDRQALPVPKAERPELSTVYVSPQTPMQSTLVRTWSELLELDTIGIDDPFFELGGNSLLATRLLAWLKSQHSLTFSLPLFFDRPTIRGLESLLKPVATCDAGATATCSEAKKCTESSPDCAESTRTNMVGVATELDHSGSGPRSDGPPGFAIVGMSARFPGAENVQQYWENIINGEESIRFFRPDELDPSLPDSLTSSSSYVAARGVMEGAAEYDAAFFGDPPRWAEIIDPQQRVLLELAWTALEDAGICLSKHSRHIGVWAGTYSTTYWRNHLSTHPDLIREWGEMQIGVGNEKDFIATRIAHKLNLTGPAINVNTACSTSLVAVAQACYGLSVGDCDVALAGASSIHFPQASGHLHQPGSIYSADGHCRPFDQQASGTLFSDGAGVVVLKRLADARRDGDRIYGVIVGIGLNNDGGEKASFSAPSVRGQAAAIEAAHRQAKVPIETVQYVEAHGTATPLGDPIEWAALQQVFEARTEQRQFCGIGSVKSNIGHAVAAAGIAGLIKTVLSLHHELMPRTLHYVQPNPQIDVENSPFYVVDKPRAWPRTKTPRRAGVSSFGVGGTNAHLIVEESPTPTQGSEIDRLEVQPQETTGFSKQVIALSAKSPTATKEYARRLAAALEERPTEWRHVLHTMRACRESFGERVAGVVETVTEAIAGLRSFADGPEDRQAVSAMRPYRATTGSAGPVFLFPGQGAQAVGMGQGLYRRLDHFRDSMNRCAEILEPQLGLNLCDLLYRPSDPESAGRQLQETRLTQPALFAIGYSLASQMSAWGCIPRYMLGHSIGEFVAACHAGVFSVEDGLHIIAKRGELMQQLPPGAMMSVRSGGEPLATRLSGSVAVAAYNSPQLSVVAGPIDEVEALRVQLEAEGVVCKRLSTSHAFHSPMMDPIVEPFEEYLQCFSWKSPSLPIISTVTGELLTAELATSPRYWAEHLRRPVRFATAAARLWQMEPKIVCLELGPRRTLATLMKQQAPRPPEAISLTSLGEGTGTDEELDVLIHSLAVMWGTGCSLDWDAVYEHRYRRCSAPTYPFQRRLYFVPPRPATEAQGGGMVSPEPGETDILSKNTAKSTTQPLSSATAENLVAAPSQPVNAHSQSTPSQPLEPVSQMNREPQLMAAVYDVFENSSGFDLREYPAETTFFEMGLDSLVLTQTSKALSQKIGMEVTFRQLLETFPSVSDLVAYLDQTLPPDAFAPQVTETTASPDQGAVPTQKMSSEVASAGGPECPASGGVTESTVQSLHATPDESSLPLPANWGLVTSAGAGAVSVADSATKQIISSQLQIMAAQLQLLSNGQGAVQQAGESVVTAVQARSEAKVANPAGVPVQPIAPSERPAGVSDREPPAPVTTGSRAPSRTEADGSASESTAGERKPFGAAARVKLAENEINQEMQTTLDAFVARYVQQTSHSKRMAQEHRRYFADPRTASGFRPALKEMTYPIVVQRSKGPYLWDIDDNRYIDLTCGFGSNLLGHSPDFMVQALQQQLATDYSIGPQTPLAGQVAKLFCELTGAERCAFANTGSEAVLAATRLARTYTGRQKIVMFQGDYHGILDEVIVRGNKKLQSFPAAMGIPHEHVSNTIILEYGDPAALDWIEQHLSELAAIVVEPVQGRRPEFQPREFLQRLGQMTQNSDTALIFDEVITGLRIGLGGAQAYFGVQADLAVYGKVVGGGMPVGVIAGKACYMNGLDGGYWQFGDDSRPEAGMTYFAGTFVRHPLVMAAAKQVLEYLQSAGQPMYDRLNALGERMARELNDVFASLRAPMYMAQFGSLLRVQFPQELTWQELIFAELRRRGFFVWDHRACLLTVTHDDSHVTQFVEAFRETLVELQANGFIPQQDIERPESAWRSPTAGTDAPSQPTTRQPAMTTVDLAECNPVKTGAVQTYPIQQAQLEVWLASVQSAEASCAYNEISTLVLRGTLDRISLRRAVTEVLARHESLRSTFDGSGSEVHVHRERPLDWEEFDWCDLPESDRQAAYEAMLGREAQTPFDLEHGPLVRFRLQRWDADSHRLTMTAHHLVMDGWSFGVIAKEFGQLYDQGSGCTAVLGEPQRYQDYAAAMKTHEASEMGAADRRYWLDQFAGSLPVLELPVQRPRTPVRSYRSERYDHRLPADLVQRLRKLGAKSGCSLYNTLLAGFQAFVGRLASTSDVVVGIPTAGQSALGFDNLVGHCVNTLPLRLQLDCNRGFATLLPQSKRTFLNALDHQRYSLGSLLRDLAPKRDASRPTLCSVLFNLDPSLSPQDLGFKGLDVQVIVEPRQFENFDWFVNGILHADQSIELQIQYNSDYFEASTLQLWFSGFEAFLDGLIEDPDRALDRQPLWNVEAYRETVRSWNQTEREFPLGVTVSECLREAANDYPDRVAIEAAEPDGVVLGAPSMTYRMLLQRVDEFAEHLLRLGVRADDLVGVCLDRQPESLAWLLAVWKVGAGYVPLDPGYPAERLVWMIKDSGLKWLLTQPSTRDVVERLRQSAETDGSGAPVPGETGAPAEPTTRTFFSIDISELPSSWNGQSDPLAGGEWEQRQPDPNRTAYVIYTSGSTGRPKGVNISQRNVTNFLMSMREQPGFASQDRLLAVTTLSFDISVLEWFLPLLCGGTVVLAERSLATDGPRLAQAFKQHKISVFQATPSTFRMLLDSGWESDSNLKLLCGGEAMPPELLAPLVGTGVSLWNMYGPTETTVWSTVKRLGPQGEISIGRPIANTQVYVVDPQGQEVPVGVEGELWIAGEGVGLGYLGQPSLNVERFVPMVRADGVRVPRAYRTGDVVMWTSGGELRYCRRNDKQVKIRGHRIELGEIEQALLRHELVEQAVVMVREETPSDPRLVAYCRVKGDPHESQRDSIRHLLRQQLPAYMCPQAIVLLESFPTTDNGKVDAKRLPLPDQVVMDEEVVELRSPSTEEEMYLANVWREALRIATVGLDDNFFDIGGHSLLVVQVIRKVEEERGVRLGPQEFLLGTLEQLAARLSLETLPLSQRTAEAHQRAEASLQRSWSHAHDQTQDHDRDRDSVAAVERVTPGTESDTAGSDGNLWTRLKQFWEV